MRKPLIGLTCAIHQERDGTIFYGTIPSYTRALDAAGALPLLIVPNLNEATLREIYERVDAILLTGGGDVAPSTYGAANASESGKVELRSVDPDRDSTEIKVTRWSVDDDKPLLGICRGIQVMNVALGGTLYQDIATEYGVNINHDLGSSHTRDFEGHTVEVREGSQLAALLGDTNPHVNSMHHQAIRNLGHGFLPVATAPDGLIEGIERDGARFIVGVQWHPEELFQYSEPMRRLFEAFVREAAGES